MGRQRVVVCFVRSQINFSRRRDNRTTKIERKTHTNRIQLIIEYVQLLRAAGISRGRRATHPRVLIAMTLSSVAYWSAPHAPGTETNVECERSNSEDEAANKR